MEANPLEVLGVPSALVARERSLGGFDRLLRVAKANFKILSKEYHPDRLGGDAAIMASLTQAIEDLDDAETLAYYADELLGEVSPGVLRRQREQQQRTTQQRRAYARAIHLLAKTHQYEALELEGPTSLLVDFSGDRLILEVRSPNQTRIALVGAQSQRAAVQELPRFADGIWSEWSTNPDGFVDYTATTSLGDVRVIGGVSESDARQGPSSGPLLNSGAIEQVSDKPGDRLIAWHKPEHAWYMPFLRAYQPGDSIVIMQASMVALTDPVLAQAPL